ncbi:MAG: tetratricopeptide repeat protein [Candidatus Obscuribacterales bacterium]
MNTAYNNSTDERKNDADYLASAITISDEETFLQLVKELAQGAEALTSEAEQPAQPTLAQSLLQSRKNTGSLLGSTSTCDDDIAWPEDPVKQPVVESPQVTSGRRRLRYMQADEPCNHELCEITTRTTFKEYCARMGVRLVSRCLGREDVHLPPYLDVVAEAYYRRKLFDQAEQIHMRSLALRRFHLGRLHEDCALNLEGLARIKRDTGKCGIAARHFKEAIEVRAKCVRKLMFFDINGLCEDKATAKSIVALLGTVNELAMMYCSEGKYEESQKQFEHALAVWNSLPLICSEALLVLLRSILLNYKYLLVRMDRYEEAEAIERRRRYLYD